MEIRAKFELIVEKHELVYATVHQMYSPEREREREREGERGRKKCGRTAANIDGDNR